MKYCKLDEKYFSFRCKFFNAPQTTASFLYFLFCSLTHTHTQIHVVHFLFSLCLSFSCVFICMFYIFFWYCLYQVACQPSKLRHITMIISFFLSFFPSSFPLLLSFFMRIVCGTSHAFHAFNFFPSLVLLTTLSVLKTNNNVFTSLKHVKFFYNWIIYWMN